MKRFMNVIKAKVTGDIQYRYSRLSIVAAYPKENPEGVSIHYSIVKYLFDLYLIRRLRPTLFLYPLKHLYIVISTNNPQWP